MTARIGFLVADLGVGGIQSMVDALARGLDRGRFAPSFLCFDSVGAIGEALQRDGFEVHFLPRSPGIDLALPRAIRRVCAELRVDLVHAHNRTALFQAVLARGFGSRPRLVYTEHDRSFPEALKVRLLHAALARRVDRVAAVCGAVRDAIVATERFPPARTQVIVNGVRDPRAADLDADLESARREVAAEFSLDPRAPLVLAIGHLTPVKDHATLLAAFERLPRDLRASLIVAGDGPLRGDLESLRDRLGLGEIARFPGYRSDVDRLLRACDVLAMSSRSEGLSIALVEALARGVPIVATAVGGNSEVVLDGVNGKLVPSADPGALAAAIEPLLRDEAARRQMGAEGRRRFESGFRLETMIARYEQLYLAALG